MRVHLVSKGVRHSIPFRFLRRVARRALRAAGYPPRAALEVALVDDATMARLNWRYLRHRGSTDVLTFPAPDDPHGGPLGEIVISLDRARRQARQHGHAVRREVAVLLVHGILHLRGEDDRTTRTRLRMHAKGEAILRRALDADN